MKKILLAAAALIGLSTAAMADPLHGLYVGGALGDSVKSGVNSFDASVNLGYELCPYGRVELDYDHTVLRRSKNGDSLVANAIVQYKVGPVVPYVLVGAGLGMNGFGTPTGAATAVYDVGAGVRVPVTPSVDVDARYRYVSTFSSNVGPNAKARNVETLGVSFKF